jgi:hypothetical protein
MDRKIEKYEIFEFPRGLFGVLGWDYGGRNYFLQEVPNEDFMEWGISNMYLFGSKEAAVFFANQGLNETF